MQLSKDVRNALTSGHLAHLVTLEPDGTPQVTLVPLPMKVIVFHALRARSATWLSRSSTERGSLDGRGGRGGFAERVEPVTGALLSPCSLLPPVEVGSGLDQQQVGALILWDELDGGQ